MAILITGTAGFIGAATSLALLEKGEEVIGIDNLNDYYTPLLKKARLAQLKHYDNFRFIEADIADHESVRKQLSKSEINQIIHLAAQAGVRYSLQQPFQYTKANITGHLTILELARDRQIDHMVYASSSSIYGLNSKIPFSENDITDRPASLYGATKKSDELLSASYAHLYHIPLTGLRFFTVYGPWGRPDMAYWIFTEKILRGEPIDIFNHGNMSRDFTYIDDIVDGILRALAHKPDKDQHWHQIYNLGNDQPEKLMDMVELLESALGIPATKNMMDMQAGDVERTWADISKAKREIGYAPKTSLKEGIDAFIAWRKIMGKSNPDIF